MSNESHHQIAAYQDIADFVAARLKWLSETDPEYSIRKAVKHSPGGSTSLVTQVAKGKRSLTRDRVPFFAEVLRLSPRERNYLDRWVSEIREPHRQKLGQQRTHTSPAKELITREPQNQLLSDWLNVYVKDAVRLKNFRADVHRIFNLLEGLAPKRRIKKSLDFLVKEGFLRKDISGRLVEKENVAVTSDNVPERKIRQFHKRSLDIAKNAIDNFSIEERRASAVVLPLTKKGYQELCQLVEEFHQKVTIFAEENATSLGERLYQVVLHLSPVSGAHIQQKELHHE